MAQQATFKVSKTGVPAVTVNASLPESVDDPRWQELGASKEAVNGLAVDSIVIKMQAAGRAQIDGGAAAVQKAVDGYQFGQRGGGGRREVKIAAEQVKEAKFNAKQLELLRAAGVKIEDFEVAAA